MTKAHFSKVPWWVLELIASGGLSSSTLVTYVALGKYVNWSTGTGAWPSVETLMKDTGLSERSVRGHIGLLTEAGVIRKQERFVKGQQTTNLIELVQDPAGLGVQDSAPKQEPSEQDAAAVGYSGTEQQPDAAAIAAHAHAASVGLPEPVTDQRQQESEGAMDVMAEVLGAKPVVYVCDGCMKRVTRTEVADMADGEHVLCHECKDGAGVPKSGTPDPPLQPQPFPLVEQRKLSAWFGVASTEEAQAWISAWDASQAIHCTSATWYEPQAHMAIYLSRCREERRRPRSDLWLRFYIEDRAKHIQTLAEEAAKAERRDEDPAEKEARRTKQLPPVDWGTEQESE